MWLIIAKNRRLKPNAERDAGYEAFTRNDYSKWSSFLTIFTHFFFLPRFILGWLSIMLIGMGFPMIASIGIVWITKNKVYTDYSKYLGP